MEMIEESRQHVIGVASEVLVEFDAIAGAAREKQSERPGSAAGVLANPHSLTGTAAISRVDHTRQALREGYQALSREPAIARVVLEGRDGARQTYYICRTTPITGLPRLASNRGPIGRAAAMQPGSEFRKPDGTAYTVVERALLRPDRQNDAWDSVDSILESLYTGPLTIASLRALLRDNEDAWEVQDLLSPYLIQASDAANLQEGVRRGMITKMGLRDQPILDQYQDGIFRLPLQKRLLLLGPPGTGKTTTLIRRLGQKLDMDYLEEDERRDVDALAKAALDHRKSWLMFTPTELLKLYLKDAFAREQVPAPPECVRTWEEHRRELARNTFGVLKTPSGGGPFVLREQAKSVADGARTKPIEWYEDFAAWQKEAFLQDLRDGAMALMDSAEPDPRTLGARLGAILERGGGRDTGSILEDLARYQDAVSELAAGLRERIDAKVRGAINLHLNRDRTLLDQLARFLDGLQQSADVPEEEVEEAYAEDDETSVPATSAEKAVQACARALEAQARAAAGARAPGKTSRNGRVLEWLGDRTLPVSDRAQVGANLLLLAHARRFTRPVKKFLFQIPGRYRTFRRVRQEQGRWYRSDGFESRDIHPLELDLVLLAMLRAAAELTGRRSVLADIESPAWSPLRPIILQYRNQILVDEATDFSPIQLACMSALSQPFVRSFFACGDFHQRLTVWGTRSIDEWRWIFPDIDVHEVTVTYRQSRQLNDLAQGMVAIMASERPIARLPERVDNEGIAPALLEHAADGNDDVAWLADRIREIERFLGPMPISMRKPSIAVFVVTEDDVAPWATKLGAALAEDNINVVACPQGRVMGEEHDVRVFNVQHIKGLEFEAVFFVGVDWLASEQPELFDKYLYVGMTRAATYLGITCDGQLPTAMESLRPQFVSGWDTAVSDV